MVLFYDIKEVIKYMNSRIPTKEEKIELVEYLLRHDYNNALYTTKNLSC